MIQWQLTGRFWWEGGECIIAECSRQRELAPLLYGESCPFATLAGYPIGTQAAEQKKSMLRFLMHREYLGNCQQFRRTKNSAIRLVVFGAVSPPSRFSQVLV